MKLKISLLMFLSVLLTGCSYLTISSNVNNKVNEEEWKKALSSESFENSTMNVQIDDIDCITKIEVKFASSKMLHSIIEYCKGNEEINDDEGLVDLTDYRIARIYFSKEKNVADSKYMCRSTMFNSPDDVTYEYMLKLIGFNFINNLLLKDYYNVAVYENGQYIIDGDLIENVVLNNEEMDYTNLLLKYTFKDKKIISIKCIDKNEESFSLNVNFSNIGTTTFTYDTSAICTHQFSSEHDMIKGSEVHQGICALCSELDKHGNYNIVSEAHIFENGICVICGWEIKNKK